MNKWIVFSTSIEKQICSLLFPISRESSYLLKLYIIERDAIGYRTTDRDEVNDIEDQNERRKTGFW